MTRPTPLFRLLLILAALGGAATGARAQTPWSVARARQLTRSPAPRVQPKAWVLANEPRSKKTVFTPGGAPSIETPPAATSPAPMLKTTPSPAPGAPVLEPPKPVVQAPIRALPAALPVALPVALPAALPAAPEPVLPVDSSYPMACELRLVRLSDGKVLVQRSRLQAVHLLPQLVSEMVGDLIGGMDGDAKEIVIISLGNRRQTPMGKVLAKELTDQVTTQMNRATRRTVYSVDLRKILQDESEIERATHLMTHPEVRKRIAGAQYAIQGGVAICGPDTRIVAPSSDTDDR